jgi:predicted peroxiredoxin
MKYLFLITALLLACNLSPNLHAQDEKKSADGAFIHISHGSDDPHRLLMGLKMADMMADMHPVLVYFDVTAVDAVLSDSEDITHESFPSSKTLLKSLQEKGVTLMACPGCLKAMDKGEADLAEGVQIADKAKFFNFTDGHTLSFSY